eukprot:GHUV01030433.1.p2 GENE.GHUV01030433.1~~GHUV01030433.1.p2  ORF type:complete len:108 (-),score=13.66 GHUV01030433.1:214-537(-)
MSEEFLSSMETWSYFPSVSCNDPCMRCIWGQEEQRCGMQLRLLPVHHVSLYMRLAYLAHGESYTAHDYCLILIDRCCRSAQGGCLLALCAAKLHHYQHAYTAVCVLH